VTIIRESTLAPFPGMGPFAPSATVANEIAIRQFTNGINAANWVGFLGEALNDVPVRERIRFVFSLTVQNGSTAQDVDAAIDVASTAALAGGGIGTDRANSDGTPTLSQLAIKRFAGVWGSLPMPATNAGLLAILAIGLGWVAMLALRRRATDDAA